VIGEADSHFDVLAHELAHVRNRDAAVMTLASFLPALTNGEYRPLEARFGPWGRRVLLAIGAAVAGALLAPFVAETTGTITLGAVAVLAGATYLLAAVALGVLTTPVVYLGRSLSRYREFAADEAATQFTGEPAALASALRQLDDGTTASPAADKRTAYAGVRGLCFLPHGFRNDADRSKFYVEIRSHPPTGERVERLKAVAGS
jgi:heat shock protein HtpX